MALFFTKLYDGLLSDPKNALQYVENAIRRVNYQAVPQHKRWTEAIKNHTAATVYLGKGKKLPQPQLASEETMEKERSTWDDTMRKQYKTKTDCFLNKCAPKGVAKSALAENEKVELERFTYLEKQFKWIPKHTSVFYRRTNLAEYCLVITGHLVRPATVRQETSNQELIYYEEPCPPYLAYIRSGGALTGIAKSLGEGLLGGIYGCVAALIFNSIFPPGTPSYFSEVYKQIEDIVNKELTQDTIDEINAQINAMKDWVAVVYTSAKESGTQSKQDLTDLIQPREPDLAIHLVGVLMDDRYASTGITGFMIGAGMHLAILQELAFVDPAVSAPKDSFYVESVKKYAQSYADHAKSTTNDILNKRKGKVTAEYKYWSDGTNTYNNYWFKDHITGYRSDDWLTYWDYKGEVHDPNAGERRNEAMAKYQNDVASQLRTDMEDPLATADQWLKLKDQPLPPV